MFHVLSLATGDDELTASSRVVAAGADAVTPSVHSTSL